MSPKLIRIILLFTFLLGLGIGIYLAFYCEQDYFLRLKKLSEGLFSAFLSIASILFAFETFIIFKIKEGVYDSNEYRTKYKEYIEKYGLYTNLKRFSNFLLDSTIFSFLTAIVLLDYIVTDFVYIFPICLAFIFISITSLIIAWKLMKNNLNRYFDSL